MLRSLYSSVAGLKANQMKMDVIGNNISNVNTIGFKASTVNFSDVLYETIQNASGPNAATGTAGSNAMQVGLGTSVSAISQSITKSGASERTDNPLDIMIEGNTFFIVNSGGTNYFTKAGSFQLNSMGALCTSTGANVMGWQVSPDDETIIKKGRVSALNVMSQDNLLSEPQATKAAYVSGNIDSKDPAVTSDSGLVTNVTFYDKMGNSYTVDLKVKQTEDKTNTYNVTVTDVKGKDGKSIFVKATPKDGGGFEYDNSTITSFTFGGKSYEATVDKDTGVVKVSGDASVLTFNAATGKFVGIGDGDATDKKVALALGGTSDDGTNQFESIDIDFSPLTMYASNGASYIGGYKGSLEGTDAGRKIGNMKGISVDESGKIFGKYDNGDSKLLGQIAVASFSNPAGLESVGNSMYAETQNSGEFNGVGQDPTTGGGGLTTGVLEMSNVDLSEQFTQMITTQRGFQANSRIITTSDTLLEELINLKR
jgi:fagellar hook-basal body proteins